MLKNLNDAPGLDTMFFSSQSSESDFDIVDDINDNNGMHESDAVSLSSSVTSLENVGFLFYYFIPM